MFTSLLCIRIHPFVCQLQVSDLSTMHLAVYCSFIIEKVSGGNAADMTVIHLTFKNCGLHRCGENPFNRSLISPRRFHLRISVNPSRVNEFHDKDSWSVPMSIPISAFMPVISFRDIQSFVCF